MSFIDILIKFDHIILGWIIDKRTDIGGDIFHFITLFGEKELIIFATIVLSIAFWKKYCHLVIGLMASVLGAGISVYLLKLLIHRMRPSVSLSLITETTFSFPSGHSTIAFAFYGFLIFFLYNILKEKSTRLWVVIGGIILVLLIGLSRLYLGVHYPSDVLSGFVLGGLWLLVGIDVAKYYNKKT